MATPIPVIPFNPQPAPGVPNVPSTTTSGTGTSPGNGTTPASSGFNWASPRRITNDLVISRLLRPSLTSHFECSINPPSVAEIRKYYYDNNSGSILNLLCTEASLPGSSILTNEINDDYTGVTERLGYRRQYDNQIDLSFYVDHGTLNGGYNAIRLFEAWMRYAMGETSEAPDKNYNYRVRFPDGPTGYRSHIYVTKFERDFQGNYLQYGFVQAYPISIASIPVSYDSSQLLKCTVSFTYNRYVLKSMPNSPTREPTQQTAPGIPNPSNPVNPNTNNNPSNPNNNSDINGQIGDFYGPYDRPAVPGEAFGPIPTGGIA
jgi:hypothetical protein